MSTFKAMLFDLFDLNAYVVINGYEITECNDVGADDDGNTIVRCGFDDIHEWLFVNQEVTIWNGMCHATTTSEFDGSEQVAVSFWIPRAVEASDLETWT
jgi:hypothetical protein